MSKRKPELFKQQLLNDDGLILIGQLLYNRLKDNSDNGLVDWCTFLYYAQCRFTLWLALKELWQPIANTHWCGACRLRPAYYHIECVVANERCKVNPLYIEHLFEVTDHSMTITANGLCESCAISCARCGDAHCGCNDTYVSCNECNEVYCRPCTKDVDYCSECQTCRAHCGCDLENVACAECTGITRGRRLCTECGAKQCCRHCGYYCNNCPKLFCHACYTTRNQVCTQCREDESNFLKKLQK
jgi:hypothetical protein